MDLGIESDWKLVYEGSSSTGYPIWPSPIILPARFVSPTEEVIEPSTDDLGKTEYIFREVSFDPVTRVRRGYLYSTNRSTQPDTWHLNPHPAINHDGKGVNRHGLVTKRLFSFGPFSLKVTFRDFEGTIPLVVLGTKRSYTIWNILTFETDTSGRELVALKSRVTYGALPNLDVDSIPPEHVDAVSSAVSGLLDDIHTAGPTSVVDRCRDAATSIVSAYCQSIGISTPGKEPGKLVSDLRKLPKEQKRDVVADLLEVIRLLHTRGKSSVHEIRNLRKVTEQDAEIAVQAVGVILCDLCWGSWS